jgi:hypothetical protein
MWPDLLLRTDASVEVSDRHVSRDQDTQIPQECKAISTMLMVEEFSAPQDHVLLATMTDGLLCLAKLKPVQRRNHRSNSKNAYLCPCLVL